jgi:hypothetical protein
MILKKVTVTGIDDSTSIPDIHRFIALYPKIEFGVLIRSPWRESKQNARFPTFQWLERLCAYFHEYTRKHFSLHLCGLYVQDFFTNTRFVESIEMFFDYFSRVQINTHNVPYGFSMKTVTQNISNLLSYSVTPILQYDDGNKENIEAILLEVPLGSVHVLHDMSHGAGKLPEKWNLPLDINGCMNGYSGGLTPQNVVEEIIRMNLPENQEIWIDAETYLRTMGEFDLLKAAGFYNAAMLYHTTHNGEEE